MTGWMMDGVDDGSNWNHGTRAVNLRGLGPAANLVLINGLRMPFYENGGDVYPYYNISAIPMGCLEGVQVLSDGASAV